MTDKARLVKLNRNIYLEWPDRSLRIFSADNSQVNGNVFDTTQCSTPPIDSMGQFLDHLQDFLPNYSQTPFQSKPIQYNDIKPGQWFTIAKPLTHGSTFMKLNNGQAVRILFSDLQYVGEIFDNKRQLFGYAGYWMITPTDLLNIQRPVVASAAHKPIERPTKIVSGSKWAIFNILG